ncbi:MAG: hypothetical protein ACI81A_000114, partial [Paraglaciecola sp.]
YLYYLRFLVFSLRNKWQLLTAVLIFVINKRSPWRYSVVGLSRSPQLLRRSKLMGLSTFAA